MSIDELSQRYVDLVDELAAVGRELQAARLAEHQAADKTGVYMGPGGIVPFDIVRADPKRRIRPGPGSTPQVPLSEWLRSARERYPAS